MNADVSFRAWRPGQLAGGTHLGTRAGSSGLRLAQPAGTRRYADPFGARPEEARDYEWAAWVSPAVRPVRPFTSLVPSWNARTPHDSWLELEVRTSRDGRRWSGWYSMACWAETTTEIRPTTRSDQDDEDGRVRIELLTAQPGVLWTDYQLRVALHRRPGSRSVPVVTLVGAMVGEVGDVVPRRDQTGGVAHGVELQVPAYSQHLHRGEYPEWDNGGASWCSPAATSMVLGTWGLGPGVGDCSWVRSACADPQVDHAARGVFDHDYGGTGNWAFNTAYAARYGAEAFVTRLRSLAQAERFVAAGIPLVASIAFKDGELEGAGYASTGHLVTVVGFDEAGRVICNDPASHEIASNDHVRVVYDRAEFERAWQGSAGGGVVYVVRPHDVPLPPHTDPDHPNW